MVDYVKSAVDGASGVISGILFGSGMIIAAFIFQSLWHVGFCGK